MAASGEKPYRVYRGGRTKGKVPLATRERDRSKQERSTYRGGGGGRRRSGSGRPPAAQGWTWRRWTWVTLVVLIVLLVVWGVAGYFSVRSGVKAANERLPGRNRAALARRTGCCSRTARTSSCSAPTTRQRPGRTQRRPALRLDDAAADRPGPASPRLPLDPARPARVDPGPRRAEDQRRDADRRPAARRLEAVAHFTGLPINHVVIVDFGAFKKLIDAVGGIDVNVPENILSNRFDCPYAASTRCDQWQGWRFQKGVQHMDGHRALIYSRIRENRLNPADTDISRGAAPAAGDAGDAVEARERRARSSAFRSAAATCSRRSRPTSRRGSSCSSAG